MCDENCMSSKGTKCTCTCGGRQHGILNKRKNVILNRSVINREVM